MSVTGYGAELPVGDAYPDENLVFEPEPVPEAELELDEVELEHAV